MPQVAAWVATAVVTAGKAIASSAFLSAVAKAALSAGVSPVSEAAPTDGEGWRENVR